MRPEFKRYASQIVKNSRALARELKRLGFDIISGGTDNHLMLVDVTKFGISGREAQDRLENIGIVVNRNTIPYDTRSPFDPSGIRIGTPVVTSRGMKEREMKEIASIIFGAFGAGNTRDLARRVRALTRRFPIR